MSQQGLFFLSAIITRSIMQRITIKRNKEDITMILLLILLLTAGILTVISVAVISVTGAIGIVLFGDVIVCIFVIFKVIKRLFRKKK